MEYIVFLLSKVPDVIWAAIIASFLTFFGVLLTNRGNQKSLAMQLNHDKEKFVYEQELLLKKEVFLEAAATFSQSLASIPKMANLEISMETITTSMASYGPSAAKVYVTANEETVAKVIEFSNELAEVFLSLVRTRAELMDTKNAISIYQGMINRSQDEQKRILSIMKELNLQGHADPAKWDYLNKSYELETKNIEETRGKIDELNKVLAPKHIQFSTTCMSEYARLSVLISPMIISVRSELRTSKDGDRFSTIFRESMSRMQNSYEKFIKNLKETKN